MQIKVYVFCMGILYVNYISEHHIYYFCHIIVITVIEFNPFTVNPHYIIRELRSIISKQLGIRKKRFLILLRNIGRTKLFLRVCANIFSKTDNFDKDVIRIKIHQFWSRRELLTLFLIVLFIILVDIIEDENLPNFSRSSLHRLLIVQSTQDAYSQGLSTGAINPTEKRKRLIVILGQKIGLFLTAYYVSSQKKTRQIITMRRMATLFVIGWKVYLPS